MYLYTLVIGHKSCNILSFINKWTLQKDFAKYCGKWCVFYKKMKTQQQQNNKSNIKTCAGAISLPCLALELSLFIYLFTLNFVRDITMQLQEVSTITFVDSKIWLSRSAVHTKHFPVWPIVSSPEHGVTTLVALCKWHQCALWPLLQESDPGPFRPSCLFFPAFWFFYVCFLK